MKQNNPGIVFMGTPEFAVESLKAILAAGYPVKGVITSSDKPSGRGLKLHPSPVKAFALKNNLPVLQPLKLKDPEFLEALKSLLADLQVVVAFRMLPEEVWNMPPLGTFNLHASLLPQYRGAAPINWALMNGEVKTGVTTFFLNHEIDKGSVIFAEETDIGQHETAGDVHDRLMSIGARLVVKTIDAIKNGTAGSREQHLLAISEPLKSAPKIFRNECKIKWDNDAETIYNFIRGLSPYPTAWSEMINTRGEILTVKIYFGTIIKRSHCHDCGAIESDGRSYLSVAVKNGFINIESIQLQGKKQMGIAEFLRGFPYAEECLFQ
jgi:methionyl-tRNA formyltransferase